MKLFHNFPKSQSSFNKRLINSLVEEARVQLRSGFARPSNERGKAREDKRVFPEGTRNGACFGSPAHGNWGCPKSMKSLNQTPGPEATINFDLLIVRPLHYKPQNSLCLSRCCEAQVSQSIRFRKQRNFRKTFSRKNTRRKH